MALYSGEQTNSSVEQQQQRLCSARRNLLPFFEAEPDWPASIRTVLYFLAMIYTFFGIYVAVNKFMTAVIKITSRTRKVTIYDKYGHILSEKQKPVWNRTIANLTLLAFGSSSPEILLSIIEIIGNNFKAGNLASHAIVGSAAFNVLFVTAVSNVSVPKLETRRIQDVAAYAVCSAFAIFSYIWLSVVLEWSSDGVVELWEALLTLLFFFLLLIVGYLADKKCFCAKFKVKNDGSNSTAVLEQQQPNNHHSPRSSNDMYSMGNISYTNNSISLTNSLAFDYGKRLRQMARTETQAKCMDLERKFKSRYPNCTPEQLANIIAAEIVSSKPHNQVYYRVETGLIKKIEHMQAAEGAAEPKSFKEHNVALISIAAHTYHIGLNQPTLAVRVVRNGYKKSAVAVRYETLQATAIPEIDFTPQKGVLKFDPDVVEQTVDIQLPSTATIASHDTQNREKFFYLRIEKIALTSKRLKIDEPFMSEVWIVESLTATKKCSVRMNKLSLYCSENVGAIKIPVSVDGYIGEVGFQVVWETVDETADEGMDYIGKSGQMHFGHGERVKLIVIPIIEDYIPEKHETFLVRLSSVSSSSIGGSFVEIGEPCETRVTILGDSRIEEELLATDKILPSLLKSMQPGAQSWAEQFKRAANVNEGDLETASVSDYIWHVILFFWNILFAFVPPVLWYDGWLTFMVSLALIGLLTTLAADCASIFGCLIQLPEEVTAIVFVVLGTGLPDLFASRLAAVYEGTADSSLIHAIGDSSVNVFVGLGLPWTIASAYWHLKGQKFTVNTKGLSLSVIVYSVGSFLAILVLLLRRHLYFCGSAELGGPRFSKWVTSIFLCLLYVVYIILCTLDIYGIV